MKKSNFKFLMILNLTSIGLFLYSSTLVYKPKQNTAQKIETLRNDSEYVQIVETIQKVFINNPTQDCLVLLSEQATVKNLTKLKNDGFILKDEIISDDTKEFWKKLGSKDLSNILVCIK